MGCSIDRSSYQGRVLLSVGWAHCCGALGELLHGSARFASCTSRHPKGRKMRTYVAYTNLWRDDGSYVLPSVPILMCVYDMYVRIYLLSIFLS